VGVFPQCIDTENIEEIQEFGLGYYEKIDKNFTLPKPHIRNSAKLSNLLSVTAIDSSVFKVFDDSILGFLKDFNINHYQTWKLEVEYKGIIIDKYNLFHLCFPTWNIIDFSKSIFKIKDINSNMLNKKTYQNAIEYQTDWKKLIWKGSVISFDTLYLNFSLMDLDLIRIIGIDSFGIGYYVSEKLKIAVEKEQFTGFAFQEIEEMDRRITAIY